MTEIKHISLTETAKILRNALKLEFPKSSFSVRSESYAGGSSIMIEWTDGDSVEAVQKLADKFAGASFDGSIDLKSYITQEYNGEKVYFGCDWVHTNRHISEEQNKRIAEFFKSIYDLKENIDDLSRSFDFQGDFVNFYQL